MGHLASLTKEIPSTSSSLLLAFCLMSRSRINCTTAPASGTPRGESFVSKRLQIALACSRHSIYFEDEDFGVVSTMVRKVNDYEFIRGLWNSICSSSARTQTRSLTHLTLCLDFLHSRIRIQDHIPGPRIDNSPTAEFGFRDSFFDPTMPGSHKPPYQKTYEEWCGGTSFKHFHNSG
jgi:hypothetical protein